jgi:hypothetical protein
MISAAMHDQVGPYYVSPYLDTELPLTHRNLVCYPERCGDRNVSDYIDPKWANSGIPFCRHCKRPPVWFTYRCVNCDSVFIRDFLDPKFCFAYPYCWNCLPQLSWTFCRDHNGRSMFYNDGLLYNEGGPFERLIRKHPPLGLNPQKFSDTELDDFWNDLLGE